MEVRVLSSAPQLTFSELTALRGGGVASLVPFKKGSSKVYNYITITTEYYLPRHMIEHPETITEPENNIALKNEQSPKMMTREELRQILKPTGNDVITIKAIEEAKQIIGDKQLTEYFEKNKPEYFGKPTSDQIKLAGWAFESFARNIIKLKEVGYTGDALLQAALDNIFDGLKPQPHREVK